MLFIYIFTVIIAIRLPLPLSLVLTKKMRSNQKTTKYFLTQIICLEYYIKHDYRQSKLKQNQILQLNYPKQSETFSLNLHLLYVCRVCTCTCTVFLINEHRENKLSNEEGTHQKNPRLLFEWQYTKVQETRCLSVIVLRYMYVYKHEYMHATSQPDIQTNKHL